MPSIYPQPYFSLPSAPVITAGQFDLPSVLVPPEVIELDNLPTDDGEDALVKKEEWPDYMVRLFENDVRTPLIPCDLGLIPCVASLGHTQPRITGWLCGARGPSRHRGYLRGQQERVCEDIDGVSEVDDTGDVQA